jgi:hypothetical protein
MTEPTEKPLTVLTPETKVSGRKVRSVEQLAVLAKAREKALEIRKQNQQVRQKELEIKKTEKEIKVAEIENKYQEVKEKKENINKQVPILAKQVLVAEEPKKVKNTIQSDSDDDEMVMIKIPKKKLVKYQKKVEIKSEPIVLPVRKNPLFNL